MFIKDPKEFNLPKAEEKVLEFWKKNKIFEKTLLKTQKSKRFVFFEGPPTANGRPGIHHVLARAFKDVVLRYKTMRGFFVPRRAGWDTHGLPVEIQVEKELGLKSKKDIEKYGIAEFNKKCRESVWKFKDEWERLTDRMGFWLDMKNPYVTYDKNYIETLWWIIAQFWKKKLLYKGHRVAPWCTRCGTALSSHEMAQGYSLDSANSIFVKFKLRERQKIGSFGANDKTFILSWTTTPWTLPGNVALAVNKNFRYEAVKVIKVGSGLENRELVEGETYILGDNENSERVIFWEKPNWDKDGNAQVHIFISRGEVGDDGKFGNKVDVLLKRVAVFSGRDLLEKKYEPLFNVELLKSEKSYRIYHAKFVTEKDGTGVVHTAVMYGEDDYNLGAELKLPKHHTVDETGKFTKDIKTLEGQPVVEGKGISTKTEDKIFEYLKKEKRFYRTSAIQHDYPHCWRCQTPLLYYARESWFVAMAKLKKQLTTNNTTINWAPEHVKNGRFGEWLRDVKDWNFSRERYWGTPLPIWECKSCSNVEVVGGLNELSEKAVSRNHYFFMRHGEADNIINKICGPYDTKEYTAHLTKKGRLKIAQTAKKLKKEKIDLIVSSPLARTRETAEIISKIAGGKILIEKRLIEINTGIYKNGPERSWLEYLKRVGESFDNAPPKGESRNAVKKRVFEVLRDLDKKYRNKNILFVSHGDTLWMTKSVLEGLTEKETLDLIYPTPGEIYNINWRGIPKNQEGLADLHRPYVDAVILKCAKCKGEMKRVKELADVWFDSGSMPWASRTDADFNADNRGEILRQSASSRRKSVSMYPADYIVEAVDQTRGWFYTLLAVATALGLKAPYKNVICLGHINDKMGQKMSKSKGNIVDPWVMAEKYGMDAVRWYMYSATPPGEPKNFDEQELAKTYRKFHLIFWNSLLFYKTYADQHAHGKRESSRGSINVLDQWILARLEETKNKATKNFDRYQIREVTQEIERLTDDLSRWYIRRSRRRLQKSENKKDCEDCSQTLRYVLREILKMMAPFNPFFSEILWNTLGEKDSVHLQDWPTINLKFKNQSVKLLKEMEEVRRSAALGLAKRAEAGIKVRQPLALLKVKSDKRQVRVSKEMLEILKEEVNVKKVVYDSKITGEVELDMNITAELKEEGILRELTRAVQELRQKAGLSASDRIVGMIECAEGLRGVVLRNEGLLKKEVGAKEILYKKSEKFGAEAEIKIEGENVWVGVRKI